METDAEVEYVNDQVSPSGGSAVSSEDKVSGRFSLEVTAPDVENKDYQEYTLVESDNFDTSDYSVIRLWVKPALGAEWIQFYTDDEIILDDKDNDGRFLVGQDIFAGKWNEVVLDLTKFKDTVNQGADLKVRTNDISRWYFDNISSNKSTVTSIDLSKMVNSKSEIVDGSLRFKMSPSGVYDVTPIILISNKNEDFRKTYTTEVDFKQGTMTNVTVKPEGYLEFSVADRCTGGSGISSTGNPAYGFDNNSTNVWAGTEAGTAISGNSYIGYDFKTPKNLRAVALYNNKTVTSAKLQYYDSNELRWVDEQTLNLIISNYGQSYRINTDTSASMWRLLANSNGVSTSDKWTIAEIEMFTSEEVFTSSEINISRSTGISGSRLLLNSSQGDEFKVKARLSTNGGTTWQEWSEVQNSGEITAITQGVDLGNAKIQYRIFPNNIDTAKKTRVDDVSIEIYGADIPVNKSLESGRISDISIESSMNRLQNNGITVYAGNVEECSLSGNGRVIYYKNNGDHKLYKLDISTGMVTTKISEDTNITNFKTNYDGSVIAYIISDDLYVYNDNTKNTYTSLTIGSYSPIIDVNDTGYVYIIESNETGKVYDIYSNVVVNKLLDPSYGTLYGSCIAREGTDIFYQYKNTADGKYYIALCGEGRINKKEVNIEATNMYVNKKGTKLFLYDKGGGWYEFIWDSGVLRKLNVNFVDITVDSTLVKVTDDDKLILKASDGKYVIYDPDTDERTIMNTGSSRIDNAGSKCLSGSSGSIKLTYIDKTQNVEILEEYLLSFDGKNSWYSYKNGSWTLVKAGYTPNESDFQSYGMTAEEINSLNSADFASLYDGNRQVYGVDFAVYFSSSDSFSTPSINSIKIITDEGTSEMGSNLYGQALYAVKEQEFDAVKWRKVNRLYPVELSLRDSDFYYFFYIDGKYQYYDGTGWKVETNSDITNLLNDVEANWGQIIKKGMSAEILKSIPSSILTEKLKGKSFSVVYCLKVLDKSTEKYSSKISADYVEDLFTGASLTLKITMNDGTIKDYTALTDTQVEDFMEWVNKRQHNVGPVFYTIKAGNSSYFVNYYMIQSVTVDEQ